MQIQTVDPTGYQLPGLSGFYGKRDTLIARQFMLLKKQHEASSKSMGGLN